MFSDLVEKPFDTTNIAFTNDEGLHKDEDALNVLDI